nr:hypothetical protein [Tanacetum cinerariifolium]
LVAIEETVARRTGRNTLAHERLFGRQAQVASAGASGDDQRVAGVGAAVALEGEWLAGQIHGVDVVEDDFGFETLGVFAHTLHQYRAGQAMGIARPVVDLGGGGQLTTRLHAGDQQRLEPGNRQRPKRQPSCLSGLDASQPGRLRRAAR